MEPEKITTAEPEPSKDQQSEIKEVALDIPLAKSFVYSNVAAFSVSFMDIRISFGEAMPDASVESRVGVVLPPENAAYLALALMEQVHIFERNFGPIRHPQWQEQKKKALAGLLKAKRQHEDGEMPAPETEPIQRHVKPNRQREDSETPVPEAAAPKGSRQIRFEEDEQKPPQNPDERMEIG